MANKTCVDGIPVSGDVFKCDTCGMSIMVGSPCACDTNDPACEPCFQCCGAEMTKVEC